MGQRSEEFDGVGVLGCGHFGTVLPDESGPLSGSFGCEGQLHGRKTWREVREPDVVPILRGELGLRHTTQRTPNGADAQAFVLRSWTPKPNDADSHVAYKVKKVKYVKRV